MQSVKAFSASSKLLLESLPAPVADVLYHHVVGARPIGLLQLDLDFRLLSLQGELESFGFGDLETGLPLDQQVDFLAGMLDPDACPLELPFVQMPSGISTDVHVFRKNGRLWVLLVGVEDRNLRQQSVQQKVNDLSLSQKRHSRILNQYLGEEVARRLEDGIDSIDGSGERRRLTMMFADIRGFTTFSEKAQPEDVFNTLNAYLQNMIAPVIEAQGVIDNIIGDEIMAIFGMLPGHTDGCNSALRASIRMLLAVDELNRRRKQGGQPLLQVGVGIATGPVTLGVIGSRHRKSITVIGNHVNLAARLQGLAGPGQVYLDRATRRSVDHPASCFTRQQVELKGYSRAIDAYSLSLAQISEEQRKRLAESPSPAS